MRDKLIKGALWLSRVTREGLRLVRPTLYPPQGARGINASEFKRYSQHGEDGIIAYLCARIGTSDPFFVEFGVGNGLECNTARLARDEHWRGLMIEADDRLYAQVRENYRDFPRVTVAHDAVTRENVESLFRANGVPARFDVLSIDIDGNDYWVWAALEAFQPLIVVIEYNAFYPPPCRWVMQYDPNHQWDGTTYFGASLASLTALASQKGYALIGTDSSGVNAFFVRAELLDDAGLVALSSVDAYHQESHVGAVGMGRVFRPGAYVEA